MKFEIKKRTIYTVLASLLLLCCIQVNNIKVIVDSQSLLGFELDFTEMELSLRGSASMNSNQDEQASHPSDELLSVRP